MILAVGLYGEFIDSVAEVTALRLSWRRISFLVIVGGCAAASIVGLAGAILYLLFHYTVAMFALFIGLTLGGVPLLARSLRPVRWDVVIAVLAGLALMVGVTFLKGGRGFPHNMGMDFVSGVVGSATMVLPGISGSYMLLVMDQYDRIVGAVRDLKDAAESRDMASLKTNLAIVIPVGIGVILGIVLLSNLLKVLLRRHHRATVGALLGILVGSVVGLWPFTQTVGTKALEARSVEEIRAYAERIQLPGVEVIETKEELIAHVTDPDLLVQRVSPSLGGGAVAIAIVMVAIGFGVTFALSRLGDESALGSARGEAA